MRIPRLVGIFATLEFNCTPHCRRRGERAPVERDGRRCGGRDGRPAGGATVVGGRGGRRHWGCDGRRRGGCDGRRRGDRGGRRRDGRDSRWHGERDGRRRGGCGGRSAGGATVVGGRDGRPRWGCDGRRRGDRDGRRRDGRDSRRRGERDGRWRGASPQRFAAKHSRSDKERPSGAVPRSGAFSLVARGGRQRGRRQAGADGNQRERGQRMVIPSVRRERHTECATANRRINRTEVITTSVIAGLPPRHCWANSYVIAKT